jgi:hypothetical protein
VEVIRSAAEETLSLRCSDEKQAEVMERCRMSCEEDVSQGW